MQSPNPSDPSQLHDGTHLGVLGVRPPLVHICSQVESMYVCELKNILGQVPPVPLVPLKHDDGGPRAEAAEIPDATGNDTQEAVWVSLPPAFASQWRNQITS